VSTTEQLLQVLFLENNGGRHFFWTPELREQLHQSINSVDDCNLGNAFRAGRPLYLLPPGSPEKFATFSPILRRGKERGEYIFGKQKSIFFRYWDDQTAIEAALEWMTHYRKNEIDQWLDNIRSGHIPENHQLTILDDGVVYKNNNVCYYLPLPIFHQFLDRMNEAVEMIARERKIAA